MYVNEQQNKQLVWSQKSPRIMYARQPQVQPKYVYAQQPQIIYTSPSQTQQYLIVNEPNRNQSPIQYLVQQEPQHIQNVAYIDSENEENDLHPSYHYLNQPLVNMVKPLPRGTIIYR